jgi:DNA-binding winged helix-turn-helix (wHTH) protein/Tol biopolymer transport system component
MSNPSNGLYAFGSWRLDAPARTLSRSGVPVTLPPKTFDLLVLMAGSGGRLLSKRELMEALWSGAFVEEANLSFQISSLRKALGEEAGTWIEAVPKYGYRFKAPVERSAALEPPAVPENSFPAVVPAPPSKRPAPTAVLVCLLFLACALALGWYFKSHSSLVTLPRLSERQITANPPEDWVTGAAVSPDGKYIVYNDQTGLYLHRIDSSETRAILLPPGLQERIWDLTWFPNGGELLAIASSQEGTALWKIAAMGQATPKLLYRNVWQPTVSPDEKQIAFLHAESGLGDRFQAIWVGGMAGELPRKLISTTENESVFSPAFSPDGRALAYVKVSKIGPDLFATEIEVQPTAGGPSKAIVSDLSFPKSSAICYRPASGSCLNWSPDWKLVVSVGSGPQSTPGQQENSLWQVPLERATLQAAGKPERLAHGSKWGPLNPTSTSDGKRVSYLRYDEWEDVYVAEIGRDGTSTKPPRRFTMDNRGSHLNGWTADSQAVIFSSDRNGRGQIFKQALGGNVPEIVIQAAGDDCGYSVLSPDGLWTLYLESIHAALNAPSTPSRLMRRPTSSGPAETVLVLPDSPSRYACGVRPGASCILGQMDGANLVFASLDPLRGKGLEVGRIACPDCLNSWNISPDGSSLAVVKDTGRINVFSVSGRRWHQITLEPRWKILQFVAWAADGQSLFTTCWSPDSFDLIHVTLTGKVTPVLHDGHRQWLGNIVPSPDGKYLAFEAGTSDSNVWLIENANLHRR